MPNIVIDIASEFTGQKAFAKAQKSTYGLEKSVKSLGRNLGIALSTRAILSFATASVKAFAAEDKAIRSLGRTLKNLGLSQSGANERVNAFIDTLSRATGVLDDELRPAMETLLRATGSISKSQDLLSLALDISAGTGKDLSSVVAALQKAYLGNNTALTRLGVGLSKAELKSSTFEEITAKLAKLFDGQAAEAADSYAGQINKLAVAADNAKEIIGQGLVDAIGLLSTADSSGIDKLTKSMEDLSLYIADAIRGIGVLGDKLNNIPGVPAIFQWLADHKELLGLLGLLSKIGEDKRTAPKPFKTGMSVTGASDYYTKQQTDAQKAAAKAQATAAALALKNAKATQAANQKSAALAKASAMFDLDKIQIEAALKGKISDEEKLRLELQRAILNEDAVLADSLQKKLEASQRATAALQGQIVGIKPLTDPFAAWLSTLEGIAATLAAIANMPTSSVGGKAKINIPLTGEGSVDVNLDPPPEKKKTPDLPKLEDLVQLPSDLPPTNNQFAGLGGNTGGFGFSLPSYLQNTIPQSQPAPVTVNVNVEGTVVSNEELVKVVADAVVIANTNGYNNYRPGAVLPVGG
jgi:hypothetical protein